MSNMIPISTVIVGSGGAASIDFVNIPQTYTDLQVLISARTVFSDVMNDLILQFNGDAGSNYSTTRLEGNGSGAASDVASSGALYGGFIPMSAANATANTFGNGGAYISNYTSANQKSFSTDSVAETNATATKMSLSAAIWTGTAPISSIKVRSYHGSNLVQYSTVTLYGIRKY